MTTSVLPAFLARRLSGDGLAARALRGTVFSSGGFLAENALRLAGNLVLTRLLFPEAFGLMALVSVVLTALAMFSDMGIRAAIIQDSRGTDPVFLDTAFTLQFGNGMTRWLCTVLLAAPLAAFYDEPMLAQLLPVMGLNAVLHGLNSTALITAARELRLGRVVTVSLISQLAGLLVMIFFAWSLRSVWSLVIGTLVTSGFMVLLSHFALPGHRNRLRIERAALRQLVTFGRWIFLATIASFLVNNVDRAILGKYVTLDVLAFYGIAMLFATVPLLLARRLADQIFFPLYSAKRLDEDAATKARLDRARMGLTAGLFAISATLACGGDLMVRLLYDSRYEMAGPLLVLIAVATMPALIVVSYPKVLLARGRSGLYALVVVIEAATLTGSMLIGAARLGVIGASLAPAVATLLSYTYTIRMIRPQGVWDPRHDALFGALILPIAAMAFWLNAPRIDEAIGHFLP